MCGEHVVMNKRKSEFKGLKAMENGSQPTVFPAVSLVKKILIKQTVFLYSLVSFPDGKLTMPGSVPCAQCSDTAVFSFLKYIS